jgi:hypothetical protein
MQADSGSAVPVRPETSQVPIRSYCTTGSGSAIANVIARRTAGAEAFRF